MCRPNLTANEAALLTGKYQDVRFWTNKRQLYPQDRTLAPAADMSAKSQQRLVDCKQDPIRWLRSPEVALASGTMDRMAPLGHPSELPPQS
jgi:hypothetical protein